MEQFITQIISTLALTISLTTAYLTLFRRGTVRMTQPTVIFFGPDGGPTPSGRATNKIFLRALLYATSKRGRIIECMFVKLRRGETTQNFNIWIYGDDSLSRGSGLFVGENGISCNHHFLLPKDGGGYQFREGEYELEVIAKLAGEKAHINLLKIQLSLSLHLASQLDEPKAGAYFDWGPDSRQYHPHVDVKPEQKLPHDVLEALVALRTPAPKSQEPTRKVRTDKSRSKTSSETPSA